VLFSSIVSSGNRVCGRTGMGAVMGAKNLKAVVVKGERPVTLADPLAFLGMADQVRHAISRHEEYDSRRELGTTRLMSALHRVGILPTRHFKEGVCDYLDEISGERLAREYKVKNKGCFNCNLHCSRYYVCGGVEAEGPEFETLCGFTSRIGVDDLAFALEMNFFLNQMGMDALATTEIVGWLMECRENGLVGPEDLDGLDITWGDVNAVRQIVELIAHRRGIGDQLADGATKASRGADHLRAEPYFELTDKKDVALARFGTEKAADRLAEQGKAALVTYSEKIALLTDCLTMCKNIGLCMDVLDFENTAALLTAATGIQYTAEGLEKKMADCIDREFELNRRFGVRPEDDTLPERFLTESLPDGPTKGATVDIKTMVEEYNALHGRNR